MAETQVASTTSEQPNFPPQITKNPVGRPRKDGTPAGSPARQPVELEGSDFFDSLPALDSGKWDYLCIYVFRCKPIYDRVSEGKPKYICKYGEPVDLDQIMRDHGSGWYQLKLVETGAGPKGRELSRTYVDILNPSHPPNLPDGEWLDDPRNKDWAWCRGLLQPSTPPPTNGARGETVKDVAEAVIKMNSAINPPRREEGGLLAAIMPLLDPQRQADMITSVAALMKPKEDTGVLLPLLLKALERPAGPDPMVAMLIEDRKAMREEIAALRALQATPQKDTLDALLESEEKFERMRKLFGKGGPTPESDGWVGVAREAVEKLAGPVGQVGVMLTSAMLTRKPGQTPTIVNQPAASLPPPQQAPAVQQSQPQADPAPAPNAELMQIWQKFGGVIQSALPDLLKSFKDPDRDGYDFRDDFLKWNGLTTWHAIRSEIGIDKFVEVAKIDPNIWAQLQPEEDFRKLLAQFFTKPGEEPEGEYDDQPEEDFTQPAQLNDSQPPKA